MELLIRFGMFWLQHRMLLTFLIVVLIMAIVCQFACLFIADLRKPMKKTLMGMLAGVLILILCRLSVLLAVQKKLIQNQKEQCMVDITDVIKVLIRSAQVCLLLH